MFELLAITLFRSLVYLLATLPLIIFWKAGNTSLFLHLSLIHILIYPVLGDGFAYFWPPMYRLVDGLVLAVHVTLISWLYVTMFKRGSRHEVMIASEVS